MIEATQGDLTAEAEVKHNEMLRATCDSIIVRQSLSSTLSLSVSVSLCLQAVETNLASKDSHWVFVNEVRH